MKDSKRYKMRRDRAETDFKESVDGLYEAQSQHEDRIRRVELALTEMMCTYDELMEAHLDLVYSLGESLTSVIHMSFVDTVSDIMEEAKESTKSSKESRIVEVFEGKVAMGEVHDKHNPELVTKKDPEELHSEKLEISVKDSQEEAGIGLPQWELSRRNFQERIPEVEDIALIVSQKKDVKITDVTNTDVTRAAHNPVEKLLVSITHNSGERLNVDMPWFKGFARLKFTGTAYAERFIGGFGLFAKPIHTTKVSRLKDIYPRFQKKERDRV